ncbi:MAG: DUF6089 family protein [Phaeodactylibacter xiamenensis]|uniref:DUF6089 family protein n=1 Tax=Phaeodactylibacter xiamenensis TaxID=1524460 RepID=UPI000698643E|nr:DUF6089 family protein [Phaeodactylibacter xiamenensis]MCR9053038.1 DUF6089 family protein [bacterium]
MQRQFLVLLFCFLVHTTLTSQFVDIGFTFGSMFYSGDISPSDPRAMIQEMRPAGGIFCRLSSSNIFSTRFSLNLGSVQGDDARTYRKQRDLAFRTNITEFSAIGELHAWRIRHTEYSFTFPYLYGGVGLFHFNPRREVDGEWIELQPLGTEGQGIPGYAQRYNLTQFFAPFGAGIKFITRKFTFGFEFGPRFLLTDYLDDVTGAEVNHRDIFINNGPLAAQLSRPALGGAEGVDQTYSRGVTSRDWYYMMNITVSYNFGAGLNKMLSDPVPCPKWSKRTSRRL